MPHDKLHSVRNVLSPSAYTVINIKYTVDSLSDHPLLRQKLNIWQLFTERTYLLLNI